MVSGSSISFDMDRVARLSARPNACSSPAENTVEWLLRMRSTSVVPVLGIPTTNIGSSLAQPSPARSMLDASNAFSTA